VFSAGPFGIPLFPERLGDKPRRPLTPTPLEQLPQLFRPVPPAAQARRSPRHTPGAVEQELRRVRPMYLFSKCGAGEAHP